VRVLGPEIGRLKGAAADSSQQGNTSATGGQRDCVKVYFSPCSLITIIRARW
jgi:hypothetical protein